MEKNKKQVVLLFMYILFVIVYEMTAIGPLSPTIAKIYGIKVADVGLLNIGFAVAGLFAPFFGFVADKYGIKKTIFTGMLLFSLGSFILASTRSAFFYVFARFVIGLGYYSVFGLIYSYSSLIIEEKIIGKISGFYKMIFGVAVLVSPISGSYIVNNYGIATVYILLAIMSAISCVFIFILKFPDKKVEKIDKKDIIMLLKRRETYEFMLITFFVAIPQMLFFIYYSVHLGSLGFIQTEIGKMYTIVSIGTFSAGLLILFASDKFGKLKFMLVGMLVAAVGVFMTSSTNTIILLVFSFLFGIGFDTIWGLHFTMASLVYKKGQATFVTLLSLTMALTHIITNLVSPFIYKIGGFRAASIVCFTAIILALILYIKVYYFSSNKKKV